MAVRPELYSPILDTHMLYAIQMYLNCMHLNKRDQQREIERERERKADGEGDNARMKLEIYQPFHRTFISALSTVRMVMCNKARMCTLELMR